MSFFKRLRRARPSLLFLMVSLGALSIYFSVHYTAYDPPAASGWWQVTILVLGLPILYLQLEDTMLQMQKAGRTPVLEIGIAPVDTSISTLRTISKLPTETAANKAGRAVFVLAIRNRGDAVARFVKVHLSDLSKDNLEKLGYPFEVRNYEFHADTALIRGESSAPQPRTNSFELQPSERDLIYWGNEHWTIYPDDVEVFYVTFFLSYHTDTKIPLSTTKYKLRCTVFADGLAEAYAQDLAIDLQQFQRSQNPEKIG